MSFVLSPAQEISKEAMESAILIQKAYRTYKTVRERKRRGLDFSELSSSILVPNRICKAKLSINREEIVRKLLLSEKEYLSSLRILEMNFLNRIHDHKDAEKIFAKRVEIRERVRRLAKIVREIISYHDSFLANFQYSISNWHVNKKIGEFFQQMITYLKSYSSYSKEYPHLWAAIKRDNSLMKSLSSVIKQDGNILIDLLHAPVQRVTEISSLLTKLLENTWQDHCDYKYLAAGVVNTKNLYETVEILSKKALCEERKKEIINGTSLPKNFEFDLAEDPFLWEHRVNVACNNLITGECILEKLNLHLFAFPKVLLLGTKPKETREKYRVRHYISKEAIIDQKLSNGSDDPSFFIIVGSMKWTFQPASSLDVLCLLQAYVGLIGSNPKKLTRSTSKRLSRNLSLKALKGALSARKKTSRTFSTPPIPEEDGNPGKLRSLSSNTITDKRSSASEEGILFG